jgi:uncharacterized membrane protein
VPVLTAVALERLQAGRLRTALIALGALLLVKEDMGLFVAGIGAYLAVTRPRMVPRQLLVGGLLIVGGLAYTVVATDVLIPAFGGRSNFYFAYTALGQNVGQAAWHAVTHPLSSLRLLVTPRVKLDTMLWLFGAFCFLPLLSPITLAAVPLLLERMMSNLYPNWWVVHFQYNAYLVMILVCAAVDGAARLDRALLRRRHRAAGHRAAGQDGVLTPAKPAPGPAGRLRGIGELLFRGPWVVALGCAAAMCAFAVFLVPRFGFEPALHASFYHRNAQERAAAAADAAVPSGVTIEVANFLGPQLSARDTVLEWDANRHPSPTLTSWVIADVRRVEFSFSSLRQERQRVALLESDGYKVVFRRDGYIVLHRIGDHR